MRTLLLGTDFMYKQNGDLVPLEINTSVGYDGKHGKIEENVDVFDLQPLVSFIENGNFTKVEYIGNINEFYNTLTGSISIECELHQVQSNAVTIPYIEDTETTLIIRSAYDTTALVDDTYCREKLNFMNLIKDSTFGHEFAYKDDSGNLVNTITTILDNGEHPNFILKSNLPGYDKAIYPKLYKVDNQTELDTILGNVTAEYFLMPYYLNTDKLQHNHIPVVRSFNLLLPPTLESISIGAYTKFCNNSLENTPTYNSNFEVVDHLRDSYLTGLSKAFTPKLLDGDLVEMADGTFKTALDLQIGDVVKTIEIPGTLDVEDIESIKNYGSEAADFLSGTTYSTNVVTNKFKMSANGGIATITFTDNSTWMDTVTSKYLINRDGNIGFETISMFNEGDIMVLIDTSSETISFVEKEIQSITRETGWFDGWGITIDRTHLFLTKASEGTNTSYVAIEHNLTQCNTQTMPNCYWCYSSCSECLKNQACSLYVSPWSGWGYCGAMC